MARSDLKQITDRTARYWWSLLAALCAPGTQHPLQLTAPLQLPGAPETITIAIGSLKYGNGTSTKEQVSVVDAEVSAVDRNIPAVTKESVDASVQPPSLVRLVVRKTSVYARFFDDITRLAGTRLIFAGTLLVLLAWMIIGITLGPTQDWQIAMSDAGSIQCYISDTLLMRQQQNHYRGLLTVLAELQSRSGTCHRLLSGVLQNGRLKVSDPNHAVQVTPVHSVGDAVKMPIEGYFDRICNFVATAVGSIYAFFFFWAGICIWIGFGNMFQWGNIWQLYINTAVTVELTFTTMFLQKTRQHHADYLSKCIQSIKEVDCRLEASLRQATGDMGPNDTVEIEPMKSSRNVRAIDYYADVVGSGIGVVISTIVFSIWLATGKSFEWNSNWWLFIGTYTGLVGFVDGFVLRNIYFRESNHLNDQVQALLDEDEKLSAMLGLPMPVQPEPAKNTLEYRISRAMGIFCSLPGAVLGSLVVVVALLIVATGMHWSETGQLLCNTPTMIVEGFLLLVLIEGHNVSNAKRRVQFHDILIRRLVLDVYIQQNIDLVLNP
ncbi:low-affinity Fe(2+) transport protein [Hypocenomyce scalaris]|nr:low-affinity Fe(2+) transport protein [Hypocenomyce scalaris]